MRSDALIIDNAIRHSWRILAEQRIQLWRKRRAAIVSWGGPQLDFSADIERQRMSRKADKGPIRDYRRGGNDRAVVTTNGTHSA